MISVTVTLPNEPQNEGPFNPSSVTDRPGATMSGTWAKMGL